MCSRLAIVSCLDLSLLLLLEPVQSRQFSSQGLLWTTGRHCWALRPFTPLPPEHVCMTRLSCTELRLPTMGMYWRLPHFLQDFCMALPAQGLLDVQCLTFLRNHAFQASI